MKPLSSKRAKACAIPVGVKCAVAARDAIDGWVCCVLCGSNEAIPEAHYIPRSKGGLGIERNILSLCRRCHRLLDQGTREEREFLKKQAKDYLMSKYPDWNEEELYYKKDDYKI